MSEQLVGLGEERGGEWGAVLACGFGMTVGAWMTAYISRMPLVQGPGQVTVWLMLAMIFVGGMQAARYSRWGMGAAVLAGAVSGVLDLLVLGSVLQDMVQRTDIAPMAVLWIVGSVVCNAVVAGLGGALGALFPSARRGAVEWGRIFALVLVVATLPLITIGGLVTAFRAGLAVPDWPQSYGYNMFLFPLSRMQSAQGNFYEHAHRLMGSLVGLTSLVLALYLRVMERRKYVRWLAWGIFVAVCVQGLLGGLRVTDKSVPLAITHGVFAQMVFAAMACLAAVAGRGFAVLPRAVHPGAATDRQLTALLVGALVVQLTLGAILRHTDSLLLLHITMATAVACLAVACGFRAWGIHGARGPLKRVGIAVMGVLGLQLLLGIVALAVRVGPARTPSPETALLTTAHQANGAVLLAVSAVLLVWTWRLLVPEGEAAVTELEPVLPRAGVGS